VWGAWVRAARGCLSACPCPGKLRWRMILQEHEIEIGNPGLDLRGPL
jgi:hypothetical protein